MRSDFIVMPPPALDDDLGLLERVKNLPVEQLVAHAGIETLDVTVLPWAAWRDVGCLRPDRVDPCLDRLGDELGTIVGTDVPGNAA